MSLKKKEQKRKLVSPRAGQEQLPINPEQKMHEVDQKGGGKGAFEWQELSAGGDRGLPHRIKTQGESAAEDRGGKKERKTHFDGGEEGPGPALRVGRQKEAGK